MCPEVFTHSFCTSGQSVFSWRISSVGGSEKLKVKVKRSDHQRHCNEIKYTRWIPQWSWLTSNTWEEDTIFAVQVSSKYHFLLLLMLVTFIVGSENLVVYQGKSLPSAWSNSAALITTKSKDSVITCQGSLYSACVN